MLLGVAPEGAPPPRADLSFRDRVAVFENALPLLPDHALEPKNLSLAMAFAHGRQQATTRLATGIAAAKSHRALVSSSKGQTTTARLLAAAARISHALVLAFVRP